MNGPFLCKLPLPQKGAISARPVAYIRPFVAGDVIGGPAWQSRHHLSAQRPIITAAVTHPPVTGDIHFGLLH